MTAETEIAVGPGQLIEPEEAAWAFPNQLAAFRFPHDVEGYFEYDEGAYLYTLARLSVPGLVVELGSYKGKSTICLAQARPTIAVDHFRGQQFEGYDPERDSHIHIDHVVGTYRADFDANIERYGVGGLVTALELETVAAAQHVAAGCKAKMGDERGVALVFVDADHDYEAVCADVNAWSALLAPGGCIAFHDRDFPGVAACLAQLEATHGWHREQGPGSIAVMYPPTAWWVKGAK